MMAEERSRRDHPPHKGHPAPDHERWSHEGHLEANPTSGNPQHAKWVPEEEQHKTFRLVNEGLMTGAASTTALGKRRNPIAIAVLTFVTLGVYFVYWHYQVNKELLRADGRIKVRPGLSALAVSLGWLLLFVPSFVSVYRTAARTRQLLELKNRQVGISPAAAMVLHAIPGLGFPMLALFYPPYEQSKLNRFWALEAGERVPLHEERAA
jgi:hypothetical protein